MGKSLAELVIGVKAHTGEFATGIDTASAKIDAFGNKTKIQFDKMNVASSQAFEAGKLQQFGSTAASAVGRINQLSHGFSELRSGALTVNSGMMVLQGGIEGVATGLSVASKLATGFKATLLGSGIGAVVVGIGFLISKLNDAGREAEGTTERAARSAEEIWLRSHGGTGMLSTVIAEPRSRFGLGPDTSGPALFPAGPTPVLSDTAREVGRIGIAATEATARFAEMGLSAGRSADEVRLLSLEGARARIFASPGIAEVPRASIEAMGRAIHEARLELSRTSAATRREGIADFTTRIRDSVSTFGMGGDEAELWRRNRSAVDAYGTSMAGLRRDLAAGTINAAEFAMRSAGVGLTLQEERGSIAGARVELERWNALQERSATRADFMNTAGRLMSESATMAPAALEFGSVEAQSAINVALREANGGGQRTDEQILETARRNEQEQRRHTQELERIAGILSAAAAVDSVREVLGF